MYSKFYAVGAFMIVAMVPSLAGAQTAPAGTCEFFTDFDYGGQGGQYPSTQGSYLMQPAEVPAALAASNPLPSYQMFNSPELAGSLSSVKVGPGCLAGWVTPAGNEYGFTETRQDTPSFSGNTNDKAVAVYCTCN